MDDAPTWLFIVLAAVAPTITLLGVLYKEFKTAQLDSERRITEARNDHIARWKDERRQVFADFMTGIAILIRETERVAFEIPAAREGLEPRLTREEAMQRYEEYLRSYGVSEDLLPRIQLIVSKPIGDAASDLLRKTFPLGVYRTLELSYDGLLRELLAECRAAYTSLLDTMRDELGAEFVLPQRRQPVRAWAGRVRTYMRHPIVSYQARSWMPSSGSPS